jgi:hypothetical protein
MPPKGFREVYHFRFLFAYIWILLQPEKVVKGKGEKQAGRLYLQ